MAFWTADFWEEDVGGFFKDAGGTLKGGFEDFGDVAKDFFGDVGAFFENDVLDFLKGAGAVITDDIFPVFKDIGLGLFETVKGIGGGIKDLIQGSYERFQKFVKIGDSALDAFGNPLFWIVALVAGFLILENVVPLIIHR